jgi:hypothetical protein
VTVVGSRYGSQYEHDIENPETHEAVKLMLSVSRTNGDTGEPSVLSHSEISGTPLGEHLTETRWVSGGVETKAVAAWRFCSPADPSRQLLAVSEATSMVVAAGVIPAPIVHQYEPKMESPYRLHGIFDPVIEAGSSRVLLQNLR